MASGDVLVDVVCDVKENDVTAGIPLPARVLLSGAETKTMGTPPLTQGVGRSVDLSMGIHSRDPEKDSPFQSEKQYRVLVTEV